MPYIKKKYRNGQPRLVPGVRRRGTYTKKYAEFSESFDYPVTPKRDANRTESDLVPEWLKLDRLLKADRAKAYYATTGQAKTAA